MSEQQARAQINAAAWNAVAQLGLDAAVRMLEQATRDIRQGSSSNGDFNRFDPQR